MLLDLNKLEMRSSDFEHIQPQQSALGDNGLSITQPAAKIVAHFKNLESAVVERINAADAVVGCVAWLTSERILRALSERKNGVSILVQKEDFLRPDRDDGSGYAVKLRKLYDRLVSINDDPPDGWYERKTDIPGESIEVDVAIRCVGHARRPSEITIPRMHHKFLVFCRYIDRASHEWKAGDVWHLPYDPYAVWTGSFNMTKNGCVSLENALYVEQSEIAEAYFSEWEQLVRVSESLDWNSRYAAPDIQFNSGTIYS